MARIVGGFATSHGPLLGTPPDMWQLRGDADRKNPRHFYRGLSLDFPSLLSAREPGFAAQVTAAERARRYDTCQRALDELARRFRESRPDVVVIFGNDQREVIHDDLTPAFTVYQGERIENVPLSAERRAKLEPGLAIAAEAHCPPEGATYKGAPEVARSIVTSLIEQDFDVAVSDRLPQHEGRHAGIPHAFGFVYRRLMEDVPPPSVPIFTNVGIPPNQPLTRRCLKFGHAVKKAIDDLPGDLRVALVSSGGLTHFVIDEDFDRRVLGAMQAGAEKELAAMPESYFYGNTCEIKSWYPMVAAMNDCGLRMNLVDYVACYRTEAGTGNAMGFAYWQ